MGNLTEINLQAVKNLTALYKEKGINECEIQMFGCWHDRKYCHFAHRHKRSWYLGRSRMLSEFNETLLACDHCHQKIEYDAELTEKVFVELRDEKHRKENFLKPNAKPLDKKVYIDTPSEIPGRISWRQFFAITNNIGKDLNEEQREKLKLMSQEMAGRVISSSIEARTNEERKEVYNKLERTLLKV